MSTVFKTNLPAGVDRDAVLRDLNEIAQGVAQVEARQSGRSGQGGKLGQFDPSAWEFVVQLLDTQAAAAAVQTVLGGISGYLFAKTGKKPTSEERKPPAKGDGD